ncbi:hypothetical protein K461DRAFT_323088 [Myriangium duriaei CBS 260.36]|uniref:Uncharacterized protein n=1 Tax=Myriangium duriaei CBS 260.36 TaxID=1168546 RepID=A0A9P4IXK9_9PEZI|nr:hypothetical protein K461DRAFT_323088 [Myriangium duriaei CBS 260.36]
MPFPVAVPKFIGTISLGLLTGLSYTLTTTTYPSLLLLPSATHASRTYSAISLRAQTHTVALALSALSSFGLAFVLSPRRARHPYLLWTAALALAGVGPDVVKMVKAAVAGGPSTLSRKEEVETEGVNGEMVEERVRKATRREVLRGAVSGLAFAMGVVGLWGDGA